MREAPKSVGLGALALLPILCCIGLPLLFATGVSVAVAAWIGGALVGAIVLVAALLVLTLRLRRHAVSPLSRSRS
jgi:hypothetical protein